MLATMKAMILAAGRGKRMMPLTQNTPKPLLKIAGKPLIQYTIEALVAAGITELVINHAYLGEQIETCIGDGGWLGAKVKYSREAEALNTGGGIYNALPLLGDEPFIIVNSDIWTDYPFKQLTEFNLTGLAHLVMVSNPKQHLEGDYFLNAKTTQAHQNITQDKPANDRSHRLTYSGIAILDPQLFNACHATVFPLPDLLVQHMQTQQVTGEYFSEQWLDIGTPERLSDLNKQMVSIRS